MWVKARGRLAGAGGLVPLCGSWKWKSDFQIRQQILHPLSHLSGPYSCFPGLFLLTCIYMHRRVHFSCTRETREDTGTPEAEFMSDYEPPDMGSWKWNWRVLWENRKHSWPPRHLSSPELFLFHWWLLHTVLIKFYVHLFLIASV